MSEEAPKKKVSAKKKAPAKKAAPAPAPAAEPEKKPEVFKAPKGAQFVPAASLKGVTSPRHDPRTFVEDGAGGFRPVRSAVVLKPFRMVLPAEKEG